MSLLHDFDGLCDDEKFGGVNQTDGYGSVEPTPTTGTGVAESATSVTQASSVMRNAPISGFSRRLIGCLCLGTFYVGLHSALPSLILDLVTDEFDLREGQRQALQTVPFASAAIGALCVCPVIGHLGRRAAVLASSFVGVTGCLLAACSTTLAQLLSARALAGLVAGALMVNIPAYLVEVSARGRRARTGLAGHAALVVGITVIQIIAAISVNVLPDEHRLMSWRIMCALPSLPLALMFVSFICLPESPRHLVKRGQPGAARHVLNRLYDGAGRLAVANADLIQIVEEIRQEVRLDFERAEWNGTLSRWKFGRMLQDRVHRRSLRLTVCLMFFGPACGLETLNAYGIQLGCAFGLAESMSYVGLMIGQALANVFLALPLLFADQFGRRSFMLTSATGLVGIQALFKVFTNLLLSFAFLSFHMASPHHNLEGSPLFRGRPTKAAADTLCDLQSSCMSCVRTRDCGYCDNELRGSLSHCSLLMPNGSAGHYALDGPCSTLNNETTYTLITEELDCVGRQFTFYQWTPIILISGVMLTYALGVSALPLVIVSEIHANWSRTEATSLAVVVYMGVAGLCIVLFLPMVRVMNYYGVFFIFGVISLASVVLYNYMLPETAVYDTLETADQIFVDEEREGDAGAANSLQDFRR